jgi:hypothetical protein
MSTIAPNLLLPQAYAVGITCECSVMEVLKILAQKIGVNVKSTRLIQRGAIYVDIIGWKFLSLGETIFGHLLKMFLVAQKSLRHVGQIKQNLGLQTIFIGKSEGLGLQKLGNTCANGGNTPEPQILNTTQTKILEEITVSLWSGTAISFPSKTMSVQSVNSRKLLLSETR